jgi:phosphoglycerate kinase
MSMKKTVRDMDVKGKRILVRVDFNVPMNGEGAIADDTRIRASLPTIRYLLDQRSKIILCSHLGRPGGKVVKELSLAPTGTRLSKLLERPVEALGDCVGPLVEAAVARMREGDIVLLENLRFHPEEETNDPGFAKRLSGLADIYVDDAFGSCHRSHASIVGVAQYLPALSGLLLEKELVELNGLTANPDRPFAAIIGGAKVATKLGLLENILPKIDSLLIGGEMETVFIESLGYGIGSSTVEKGRLDQARMLWGKIDSAGVRLLLPTDLVVAQKLEAGSDTKIVAIDRIPDGWVIADIGPQTIEAFAKELDRCRTVFWNGPLGVFELPPFAKGTRAMAEAMSKLAATTTVIGGGSTAQAVSEMGFADKMSFVSTGGGASLELLQGKVLPGVAVLLDV